MAYKLHIYVLHVTVWVAIKRVHSQLIPRLDGYIKGMCYRNLFSPSPLYITNFHISPFKQAKLLPKNWYPHKQNKMVIIVNKANHQISICNIYHLIAVSRLSLSQMLQDIQETNYSLHSQTQQRNTETGQPIPPTTLSGRAEFTQRGAGLPLVPTRLVTRSEAVEFIDMEELAPDKLGFSKSTLNDDQAKPSKP